MQAPTTVRVICTRPYHALFMRNMMRRPDASERAAFGTPDFTIYNAGARAADTSVPGVSSSTSVAINIEAREMVILGTEYAGEMKKGIFSVRTSEASFGVCYRGCAIERAVLLHIAPAPSCLTLHHASTRPDVVVVLRRLLC